MLISSPVEKIEVFLTLNEMVFCEILGTVFPHVVAAATILV